MAANVKPGGYQAAPAVASARVTLNGTRYAIVNFDRRTLILDCYLRRVIDEIGLSKMWFEQDESELAFGLRMERTIVHSAKIGQLLAGYLLPEGTTESDWSEEAAAIVAKRIEQLNTPEDRQEALDLAREVAGGFFRQWLEWFKRSLSYFQDRANQKGLQTASSGNTVAPLSAGNGRL